jgi:hypothetical protein
MFIDNEDDCERNVKFMTFYVICIMVNGLRLIKKANDGAHKTWHNFRKPLNLSDPLSPGFQKF